MKRFRLAFLPAMASLVLSTATSSIAQNQVQVDLDAGGAVYPFFSNSSGTATNDLTLRIGTFNSATDADVQALGYNLLWVGNQFTVMTPGTGTVVTKTINSQAGSYSSDGSADAAWTTSSASALNEQIWVVYSDSATLSSSTVYGVASSTNALWDMPASYSPGTTLKELYSSQIDTVAYGSTSGSGSTGTIRTAAAPATYLYWDSNGAAGLGGSGTWSSSTSDLEWTTNASGLAGNGTYAWGTTSGTNFYAGAGLTAYFGGTAGTVTVSGTIDTHEGMEFATTGYTLSSGTINLSGATAADNLINVTTGTATISSILAGSTGLTKNGTGTLTLSGANTYGGSTQINAGVVAIGSNDALGSTAAGTTVASGAALELSGGITVGAEALSLTGTGVSSGGALRNTSGTNSLAGAITLAGATRINSDAGTLTLSGGISGTQNLTIGGSGATTISGAIATSTGTLTKDGSGTLTLSGANTYTGLTTISAGNITLSGGSAISNTGAVSLANVAGAILHVASSETIGSLQGGGSTGGTASIASGQTLTVAETGSVTFSGTLSGTGTFEKSGTGTLTLDRNNSTSFSGAFNITGGAVTIGLSQALGSGVITMANGTTLGVNSGTNRSIDQSLILTGNVTLGSASGTGQLTIGGSGLTLTLGSANRGITVSNSSNPTILQLGISGDSGVGFTKLGAGNLTLAATAANTSTYSGATVVSAGTLFVSGSNRISSSSALTVDSGATFGINAANTVASIAGAGNFQLGSSTLTAGGDNTSTTVSGVISGATGSLTKTGSGTLTLNGTNTHGGTTTLSGGGLNLNSAAALGTSALTIGTAGVTLDNTSGGLITLNNNIQNWNADFTFTGTNDLNMGAGAVALGASRTVTVSGNTLTVGGVISGASRGITKAGAGTLLLSGANDYTGATTINAGTLSISDVAIGGSNSNIGASTNAAGNLVLGGGTLLFTGASDSTDRNFTLTAATTSVIDVSQSGTTLTISGTAASTSGALTKNGSGTLLLSGANAYTGATTINAGALRASNNTALGTTAGGVTVASGAALELTGGITIGAEALNLSGSGISSGGALRNITGDNTYGGAITLAAATRINSDAGLLTLSNTIGGAGQNLTIGGTGNTTISGAIGTTTGTLTKEGGGTLILSGANTYSGATTISLGTLQIGAGSTTGAVAGDITNNSALVFDRSNNFTYSNAISGTGSLTKNGSGAMTLSGVNSFSGMTTINSGSIRLGGSASSDTLSGDITINTGGTLDYVTSGNNNQIKDTATITVAGGAFDPGSRTETIQALSLTSGSVTIAGGNLTIGTSMSLTGGEFVMSAATGRVNTSGSLTLGSSTFNYTSTSGSSNANALVLGGNVAVNSSTTFNFIDSGGAAGNPSINLNDGTRIFDVGSSANLNINWDIGSTTAASGALTKNGSGTLTLNGTASYTGATTVNLGTLAIGASDRISNSSNLNVAGGTFNLGSFNEQVNQVTITSGTIAGTGTLTGSSYALQGGTVNANLGAGTITVSSGTTTLGGSAASTTVNISSGALALASAGTLASTATISVSSGATLDLTAKASGYSLGNGGTLNGLGTVTTASGQSLSIGTGATIAPATSSTSGTLTIGGLTFASGGTYAFTMGNATGSAGTNWDLLSVTNNFDISATSGSTFTITIGGNSGTPADFSNSGTYSWDILTLGSGSISGFSADKFTLTNNLVGITGSFSISSNTTALTLSYAPGASAVLWSSSGGSAWLTGANWTGNAVPTGIDIAQFGTNPTSPTTGVGINMGGSTNNGANNQIVGAIEVTSARTNNLIIGNSANIAGTLTLNGAQSGGVSNVVLKNSGSGNLTIQNTQGGSTGTMAVALAQNENVVVIDGAGGITVSSAITGSGKNLTLQGSGSGVFTLAGNNTYTGNTTITSRTLAVSSTGRLGGGSYSGNISNSGAFIFGSDSDQTLSGIHSGSGTLTKNGTSRLTLSGANTNTGAITVNTGALRASNSAALGTTAGGVTVASGAALELTGGISIGAEALSLTGSGSSNTGALRNISGANSYAGAITLAGATTIGSDDGTLTLTGGLTGTNTNLTFLGAGATTVSTNGLSIGSGTLTKNDAGTLTLNTANTYTGATTINGGTLNAAHASALGSTSGVTVNNGGSLLVSADDAINGDAITLASTSTTVAGLAFSGTYANTSGQAGTLTLSQNSIIDLGTGSVTIHFSSITGLDTYTLAIYNWTGTTLWDGGTGNNTDQFYSNGSALTQSQLNRISFYSGALGTSSFVGSGYQIIGGSFANQVIPVPEPEVYATAALLLLGLGFHFYRQRRRAG